MGFRSKTIVRRLTVALLASASVLPLAFPAFAATTTWTGGTSSWFTGGNWNNGIPTATDTANVSNGGISQISGAASVSTLNISGASTVDLQVGGSLAANSIFIGSGPAAGQLLLSGATNVTGAFTMANGTLTSNVSGTLSNGIDIDQSYGSFVNAAAGTTLTLAGAISGGSWVVGGAGTTVVTGNNSYTNTTITGGGTLQVGNGGGSGTLGTGSVSGNGTLVFNRNDTFTVLNVFSGTNTEIISSGTLVLTGTDQRSGATTIASGATLQIGNGGASGLLSFSAVSNNGAFVFNKSGTNTLSNAISGTGSFSVIGSGVVIVTGTNTYTGGTTISAGTLQIGDGGTTGSVTGNIVNNAALSFSRSSSVTFGGVISGTGNLLKSGIGTLILTAGNSYGGTTTISAGTLQVGNGGASGQLGPGSVIINNSSARLAFDRSDALTISNTVTGIGGVSQQGAGLLTIVGNLANTGINTVFSSMQIGNGGTAGSVAGDIQVDVSGTLTFNRSDTHTYEGNAFGTGLIVHAGTGTTVFTKTNDYGRELIVNAGTVRIGAADAANFDASRVTINSGGTYDLNGFNKRVRTIGGTGGRILLGSGKLGIINTSTVASKISGPGSLEILLNQVTLTGANTYTGGTIITAGSLQIGSGGTTGSVVGNINNSAALIFNRSDAVNFGGQISGSGTVTNSGGGVLTLTATNTYTGATTVSAGTLNVTGSIASSAVTVASGATLAGTGTVGATTVNSGGTLNLADGANATLTVNGNLSLASGASTGLELSPSAADKILVTGTAGINGGLFATFASGTYSARQYTLLTSTGARSGTFTSFNTLGLAGSGFRGELAYDANNVYLNLLRDTFVWSATPSSGDWHTNANWQNGAVPAATDVASFDATSNSAITIGQAASARSLQFNSSAPAYSFAITGTAASAASLTLSAGITNASANAPSFTVSGASGKTATLAFTGSNTAANAALTVNAFGTISFAGNTNAGTAASLTAGSGGTVDFSATTGVAGNGQISAGSIAGAGSYVLGTNILTAGALNTSTTVSGVISGTGGLVKTGTGTLTLTGANTYSGGTTVSAGTLQVGDGGTTGSVTGNISNNAVLAFIRSDALTFANVISGTGSLAKSGSGTLTLSGSSTYTGATSVNAGTLNVTGSIGSSAVSVASGATIAGTGAIGGTTVNNGGTLAPAGSGIGTLSVGGNLTLAPGSAFAADLSPTASDRASVSGVASLNGSMVVSAASGTYAAGQRYTLVSAGNLSGAFASLSTPGLPGYVKGRLSYDATNAYLNLDTNALGPLLSGSSSNQSGVAGGIDTAIQQGGTLNSAFTSLFNLSGQNLNNALDQISGQGAPNTSTAAGSSMTPFLSVMQSQVAFGSGRVASYAPGTSYAAADAPRAAQLAPGAARVWGMVYGGNTDISANTSGGSVGLAANNAGFAAGIEKGLTRNLLVGASVGYAWQDFSSGNSTGDNRDVMAGIYGRLGVLDNGYLAGAFAYSWHDITTTRVVTVAGTDIMRAKFSAYSIGGRIEGGYRFGLNQNLGLSPFAAFSAGSFDAPAYAEGVVSGSGAFALSYAANKTSQSQFELGAHLDRAFVLEDQSVLLADFRAAWAHQLENSPFVTATFQGLPGSTFRVLGVRAANDTGLLGINLEVRKSSGLSFGVRMDSQFGQGTAVVQGMGNLAWRW